MTKIPNIKYQEVGGIYGIRTWVEYGFKQCKSELGWGWADFRVTRYPQIQKWWELIMSAYLMICLHCESFNKSVTSAPDSYQRHQRWNPGKGWKNWLNNVRLILQPSLSFHLILRWLKVFPVPQLSLGFPSLVARMNQFDCLSPMLHLWDNFTFSSA